LNDAETERHFEQLAARLEAELAHSLYRHLDRLPGLESRYRAAQVRQTIEREAQDRLRRAQAAFPRRLPDEVAAQVRGHTGGFREGTTWFDAQFSNQSPCTVTSIRILVRTTDKRTGKKTEREAMLGTSQSPLLTGQTVTWSTDVRIERRSRHEFFWETLAVYGIHP
jgi:hypothetical protein